jgi:hypothetical protein
MCHLIKQQGLKGLNCRVAAYLNKELDPTALLKDIGCKHPMSPAMLVGQRRDYPFDIIANIKDTNSDETDYLS